MSSFFLSKLRNRILASKYQGICCDLDLRQPLNLVVFPLRNPDILARSLAGTAQIFIQGLQELARGTCGLKVGVAAFCPLNNRIYNLLSREKTEIALTEDPRAYLNRDLRNFFNPLARRFSQVMAFLNPSFFLFDRPEYKQLIQHALENGVAVAGFPSTREVHAIAFSREAVRASGPLITDLLRLLTGGVNDPPDHSWRRILKAGMIPPSRVSVENSPALAGIQGASALYPPDSSRYLNSALEEILSDSATPETTGRDPLSMAERIIKHRGVSKVPWIFNNLLNEIEYRIGEIEPRSFPPELHLSMTGACNLECKFCNYSHEIAHKYFLKLVEVQELTFLRYIQDVNLSSGHGEPTLNPELRKVIDFIFHSFPHIGMHFFTNGVLLNPDYLLPSLVNNGVHWINVSLNAATRESWAQYCGADHFNQVTHNLTALLQEKRARGSLHPLVFGSMVLTRSSIRDLSRMPGLCRDLGVDRFTAFPFSSFRYGRPGKYGPEEAYHLGQKEYDSIYAQTLKEAETHRVSIEIPRPSGEKNSAFGTEERSFHDFAAIELNKWRLGKLLNPLKFSIPPGKHCFFLWRQVGVGSTNRTIGDIPETHYLYPCLGPLSGLNYGRKTAVRFSKEQDFILLWRNPLFGLLREAQHNKGVCPVCDLCRHQDMRDPEVFPGLQKVVDDFSAANHLQLEDLDGIDLPSREERHEKKS